MSTVPPTVLIASGVPPTLHLRSGGLTDDPGTGLVRAPPPIDRGRISRDDVAAVLHGSLDAPHTAGMTIELIAGDTPIPQAIAELEKTRSEQPSVDG